MDKYGFPRSTPKTNQRIHRFKTSDIVFVNVLKGKKKGKYIGYVTIRKSGIFKIGEIDSINWKYFKLLQCSDGYQYNLIKSKKSNLFHD